MSINDDSLVPGILPGNQQEVVVVEAEAEAAGFRLLRIDLRSPRRTLFMLGLNLIVCFVCCKRGT
jgi:hypothetical protein